MSVTTADAALETFFLPSLATAYWILLPFLSSVLIPQLEVIVTSTSSFLSVRYFFAYISSDSFLICIRSDQLLSYSSSLILPGNCIKKLMSEICHACFTKTTLTQN